MTPALAVLAVAVGLGTWGLVAAAVNQALILLFNAQVEQPHVRRVHS